MVIAVIGLVISIVINVFLVVRHKQSRCVVTTWYTFCVALYHRYDINQSNVRYSDAKQSVSIDHTITNPESSDPDYEPIVTDHKPDCDVKMDVNPSYHCDAKVNTDLAYQATS